MEDTLGDYHYGDNRKKLQGLNPCFNGRYSRRWTYFYFHASTLCLNPCFNGRYSRSEETQATEAAQSEGLNPCFNGRYSRSTPFFSPYQCSMKS